MSVVVDGFLYQLQLQPSVQWNLKYFQLRDATLLSFQPVNDSMVVESIPSLNGFEVVLNVPTEFASFSFSLSSPQGSITFAALSEDYTHYWIYALQAACKHRPALQPSPPFATLNQQQMVFHTSPLPPPFSTLTFECNEGISKIIETWLTYKHQSDPLKDAFMYFDDILQYRYSMKGSRSISHLFFAALNRQHSKLRQVVLSPEFTHKDANKRTRYEYFSTIELCLFLCIIMGDIEGVRVLLEDSTIDQEHHVGGFTPLLLAVAENKRDIAQLLAHHSNHEEELMDILSKPDEDEYFQGKYLDKMANRLQMTRPCLDPHIYGPMPMSPASTPPYYSPTLFFPPSPVSPGSPISPISPIHTVPSSPRSPMNPNSPQYAQRDSYATEPRLLRLVTTFRVPRSVIFGVLESLVKASPRYAPLHTRQTSTVMKTVVTETDVARALTIHGLKPITRHKLHFTIKKMKTHSFEVKNKGFEVTDEFGTATWHVFTYNAGSVEMHVESSETVYETFLCVINSRKKIPHSSLNMDISVDAIRNL